ncbi:signal peptidase I [Amnibacterium kyonggiense]
MLPRRAAWTVAVITVVCRSALATIVALLLWSVLPVLVGLQTTTVMSGSMEPRLQVGDAVVVRRLDASSLTPGQVLLFDDPDHPGRLRMHRLVTVLPDGRLVTKGDANEDRDSSTIGADAVHGAAFLRIPWAGLPNYWLRTGQPVPLIGTGALVLVLMGGVRLGRLLEDPEERERRRHRGVRLRGAHRATAATVVLVVLSGTAVLPAAEAHAGYSATTSSSANGWSSSCFLPPMIGSPLLYYGYGPGPTVADLSGNGNTGALLGDATGSACTAGSSSSLTVGSSGGGIATEASTSAYPSDVTVATWFKAPAGSGGGVIADFGNSKASSTLYDRVLSMQSNGTLTFAAATVQASPTAMLLPLSCTTAGHYADGGWHLVIATWSYSTGCTLTVDRGAEVVAQPASIAAALGGYSGYWRFGGDAITSSSWVGTVGQSYFRGSLDESQVYTSVIGTAARSAIYDRGH